MARYRKVWQCRGLAAPHPGLVGTEFPILGEAGATLGTGRVVEVGDDTITFDVEVPDAVVEAVEAAGDVRGLVVRRAKDDRGTIALVESALLERPPGYVEPEDKVDPYVPMERLP